MWKAAHGFEPARRQQATASLGRRCALGRALKTAPDSGGLSPKQIVGARKFRLRDEKPKTNNAFAIRCNRPSGVRPAKLRRSREFSRPACSCRPGSGAANGLRRDCPPYPEPSRECRPGVSESSTATSRNTARSSANASPRWHSSRSRPLPSLRRWSSRGRRPVPPIPA